MAIRKISELNPPPCRHPEHRVPSHLWLEDGVYEHAPASLLA